MAAAVPPFGDNGLLQGHSNVTFSDSASAQPLPPPPHQQPGALPSFPGFANSSFTPIIQPPTNPFFNPEIEHPTQERQIPSSIAVTDDEVKEALKQFVDNNCCFGSSEQLQIRDIQMKSAFKYQLISCTEQRKTVWHTEPLENQALEGPSLGTAGPWEYRLHPDKPFHSEEKRMRIPNTSSTGQCHVCCGNGRVRCESCSGHGGSNCFFCHGHGRRAGTFSNCSPCRGTGRRRCSSCEGHGLRKCNTCQGRGRLFIYLLLIVTWKPFHDVFVSDSTVIPKKYLAKAKGSRVVSERNRMVNPFNNFPDPAINRASKELIRKHAHSYTTESIILEQKQTVDVVRVAEVTYTWNNSEEIGVFHVFGDNNTVYFPRYPDTCRCCTSCTIL